MPDQQALWHDTVEDALRDIVAALGGPKTVGHALWPGKSIAEGARYLNHCLDPERAEKLSLGELLWLLREGRQKNIHTAAAFIAQHCGYKWEVVNPEDEAAKLQRDLLEMGNKMQVMFKQLGRIQGNGSG